MTTPTCNTCKAKFPGIGVCAKCGADPNGRPDMSIQLRIFAENFRKGMREVARSMNKLSLTLAPHAKEMRKYERRQINAHLRSLQNQSRKRAHGRTRGR